MKKYKNYILPALLCLILGLVFRFALSGYSFGAYILWGISAAFLYFLLLCVYRDKHPKLCYILNKIGVYAILILIFVTITTLGIIVRSASDADSSGADYAIVLGAGVNGTQPSLSMLARLSAALKYAEENPDTVFVLSGGQGDNEDISEARCMANYLTAHGLPAERLILEEESSSTKENLLYSRSKIAEREPDFSGKVCVITEYYHLCRAKLYAYRAGFDVVVGQGGYTGRPVLTGVYYLRECAGLWWMAVGG